MASERLVICLEFARAEEAGDPYAFRFAPQRYLLRHPGGSFESAQLSWSEALLADLNALRRPDRDPVLLSSLGEFLRRFVEPLGFGETETRILSAVRANRSVLLTIRSAAAELYALPWELLVCKTTGQHIGELPGVLLRYEWPATHSANAAARGEGGRIFIAWSAAAGAVPAGEHIAAVARACREGSYPFVLERDVLEHASTGSLLRALAAGSSEGPPIAVLHILCHGMAAGSSFGLALSGEAAGDDVVVADAGRLRQLLAPFAAMVRLVVLSVCDSGNSGALGNQLGSVAQTLHRAGFCAVVASRYPLSASGSVRLAETLYAELLLTPSSLEQSLLMVRKRLAEDAAQLDWAALQFYARSEDGDDSRPLVIRPYRGLLAFQPEHGRLFFGRESEVAEILADLDALQRKAAPRLLIVAGASGTGKSSVVMAGAVPRFLATHPHARLLRMRPGSEPLKTLEALLAESGEALLVVDQLEEIFTQGANPAERSSFVRRLWQLAQSSPSQLSILVTLRVDFIGRCGELVIDDSGRRFDSVAYDEAHRLFIGQLSPDALRQVIEQPAQKVGLVLEQGLQSRILDDVSGEPGALPLLADTLDILWQKREGSLLLQSAYAEIGGVTGALRGRTEALIHSLSTAEQTTVRRLLVRLVSIGDDIEHGTRRRMLIRKVRPSDSDDDREASVRFDRIVRLFVQERLLVLDGEGENQTIEVAHEALIRGWQRLIDWVREDRNMLLALEKLEALVEQWKEHGNLLSRNQLAYAEILATQYPAALSGEARLLLQKSRTRVRLRRRLWQLAGLGSGVLMLIFASLWWSSRRAQLKLDFAQETILPIIKERSANGSAEMLLLLAKVQLGVDEHPAAALASIEKALVLAPLDPDANSMRLGCLLLNGIVEPILEFAPRAYTLQRKPEGRVGVAVMGWGAAWLLEDRERLQLWAPRLRESYAAMSPKLRPLAINIGIAPSAMVYYMTKHPRLMMSIGKVTRVLILLAEPKSAATEKTLNELL